ncbi:aldehyde dehydrogenase family protein [Amycolatopsis magusensis]|uniref:aldehyde dehydrogenase family protein n=1 Tax=Amycolatopsis magusensis TaxID=882444 RepID=UPI003C2D382C
MAPSTEPYHLIAQRKHTGDHATTVRDAPDDAPLYDCPEATAADVDLAMAAAAEGFTAWRRATAGQRAGALAGAAGKLRARAAELAPQITRETGKPLRAAEQEVHSAARVLDNFAASVPGESDRVVRTHSSRVWGLELREPAGIAALVTSWNLPLQIAAQKVGAAVAAGCSFVLKPSPLAAVSPLALAEALLDAGVPPEVCNVLQGGPESACALAAHPAVGVLSVTGSERTGRELMRRASAELTRCVLELGGKSANIVFADADFDAAIQGAVAGVVRNQGAVCTAGSRILVERPRYAEFTARLAAELDRVEVGDPYADPRMGAIRSPGLAGRITAAVSSARAAGAVVHTGEPRVSVPGRSGAYLRPVLAAEVPVEHELWQEEVFGPVAAITPFDDEEHAVRLANSTRYGLAAAVWTADFARCERLWPRLEAGSVYLNSYHRIDSVPLASSGRGRSGFGAEGGPAGVAEFLVTKGVHIPAGL